MEKNDSSKESRFMKYGRSLTMSIYFVGICSLSWFVCTTSRRKEWADILLDYAHHKRCSFSSNSWNIYLKKLKS